MEYHNTCPGIFLSRPNRFIAHADIDGTDTVCHVKNTGRCRELLVPGAAVVLEKAANPARKTAYDLVAVYKNGLLINMDSQAPNALAAEYLPALFPGAEIKPECVFGDSRIDFRIRQGEKTSYVEVKGVTLEKDGHAFFPDAPTERGAKHLRELTRAKREGFGAYILFVVQMSGCADVAPNDRTDPEFGRALRAAAEAGVGVLAVSCRVTESAMTAGEPLPVRL